MAANIEAIGIADEVGTAIETTRTRAAIIVFPFAATGRSCTRCFASTAPLRQNTATFYPSPATSPPDPDNR
jgi:hypothetical protein